MQWEYIKDIRLGKLVTLLKWPLQTYSLKDNHY